jgi:precorrin-6B methylase 2
MMDCLVKATKDEISGVVLSKLLPVKGDVLVDVGCGSGSFALFIAPYVARMITVEIDPQAAERCREALAHTERVEVVTGDALEVLEREEYDLVFFGGTQGIESMLPIALAKARKIVVNAARMEVAQECIRIMRARDRFDEALVINISKSYDLAGGTAFRSLNPVFMVISCCTE